MFLIYACLKLITYFLRLRSCHWGKNSSIVVLHFLTFYLYSYLMRVGDNGGQQKILYLLCCKSDLVNAATSWCSRELLVQKSPSWHCTCGCWAESRPLCILIKKVITFFITINSLISLRYELLYMV